MFDGKDLNRCCISMPFPTVAETTSIIERESKFRIEDRTAVERSLADLGFKLIENIIIDDSYYDTPDGSLAPNDFVIRIRIANNNYQLAFKGPRFYRVSGEYDRIELELKKGLSGAEIIDELKNKGLVVTWRLQRRRMTFRNSGIDAEVVLAGC
jgi:predicted adenylyl cyclase CyaB